MSLVFMFSHVVLFLDHSAWLEIMVWIAKSYCVTLQSIKPETRF